MASYDVVAAQIRNMETARGGSSGKPLDESDKFKGEGATLGETREAVAKLWRKLGGAVAASCLAVACLAEQPPPGCARVSDLVDDFVVTNFAQASAAPVCPASATNSLPWSAGVVYAVVESNETLSVASPGSWPEGRPVFVVVEPEASGFYLGDQFRLVGNTDLPAARWQGVVWRLGGRFYVNVLTALED